MKPFLILRRSYGCLGAVALALSVGCSGEAAGGYEDLATTSSEVVTPVIAHFSQVLRVNANETTVRNTCELTISLSSYIPMTITGRGRLGGVLGPLSTVNWVGNNASSGGLSVNGCLNYPCDVVARWRGTAAMGGSTHGCDVAINDGAGGFVGSSTGTGLTYMPFEPPQPAPVVYSQDMRLAPGGKIAGSCAFRPSTHLPAAVVDQFQVFVNGVSRLGPSPFSVGNEVWETEVDVPFGSVHLGYDANNDVTRLKHVTPLNEQVLAGQALRCEGVFYDSLEPMFIAFGDSGLGMSLSGGSSI